MTLQRWQVLLCELKKGRPTAAISCRCLGRLILSRLSGLRSRVILKTGSASSICLILPHLDEILKQIDRLLVSADLHPNEAPIEPIVRRAFEPINKAGMPLVELRGDVCVPGHLSKPILNPSVIIDNTA